MSKEEPPKIPQVERFGTGQEPASVQGMVSSAEAAIRHSFQLQTLQLSFKDGHFIVHILIQARQVT